MSIGTREVKMIFAAHLMLRRRGLREKLYRGSWEDEILKKEGQSGTGRGIHFLIK